MKKVICWHGVVNYLLFSVSPGKKVTYESDGFSDDSFFEEAVQIATQVPQNFSKQRTPKTTVNLPRPHISPKRPISPL